MKALLLVLSWCVPAAIGQDFKGEDGRAFPKNFSGPWLRYSYAQTADYRRPWWQRLARSVRVTFEAGTSGANLRVNQRYLELSGGNEFLTKALQTQAFAVELKAGVEF